MHIVILVLVPVLLTALAVDQRATESQTIIQSVTEQLEKDRFESFARQNRKIRDLEESRPTERRELLERNKQLKEARAKLAKMRAGDAFEWPVFEQKETFRVGAVGYLPYNVTILQIVDNTTLLGTVFGETIMVDGIKTATFSDSMKIKIPELLYVKGTRSYRNVLGQQRTVLVAEPFKFLAEATEAMKAKLATGKEKRAVKKRKR